MTYNNQKSRGLDAEPVGRRRRDRDGGSLDRDKSGGSASRKLPSGR